MAISTLQSANAGFIWQEQTAILQEQGRYALSQIEQALRQTSYVDYMQELSVRSQLPVDGAVWGTDARSVKSGDFDRTKLDLHAVNGSDVLAIRFPGTDKLGYAGVVNCAGFIVNQTNPSEADRGWSIFYVAKNSQGEPELRCKYRGNNEWESQAIVSGVESFQVLYGIDTDGDGLANQYLNANEINNRDKEKIITVSDWKGVVAVRISLLLYAKNKINIKKIVNAFDLFSSAYSEAHSNTDMGTRILRSSFPVESRNWYRHIVQSIIYLHKADKPG
jgi:type IV pilus assembly protein PilW